MPDPVALVRTISLSSPAAVPGAAAEFPRPRIAADLRRRIAGTAALVVMTLTGLAMVLTAAGGADGKVVNASQAGFPSWMAGVFGPFGVSPSKVRFYVLLLVMAACYFVVLGCARSVSVRLAVGAVVVRDGVIVGEGRNYVVLHTDPTAHSELLAVRDAARRLGTRDLSNCDVYSTATPCAMCQGALYWGRIRCVYTESAPDGFAPKLGCG